MNRRSAFEKGALTALDVSNYLRSLCEVREPSVDRIIIGDPELIVTKIGTCWIPYWKTLERGISKGINTFVVHEPTFYAHWDLDAKNVNYLTGSSSAPKAYSKLRDEKIEWINKNHCVIIRCHDVWDKMPEIGIPFALGAALGFSNDNIIRSRTYYNIYKIAPTPAIDVARSIAQRLAIVGQPGVAFYGNPQYRVSTIGLGTGCICDPNEFMDLEPDLFIGIDDAIRTWIQTAYAEDSGRPLVVINHGTSEEFGMRSLNNHLKKVFLHYDVIHLGQGCSYRWVAG